MPLYLADDGEGITRRPWDEHLAVVLAAAPVISVVPLLLRRMRRELVERAALRPSTAAAMWACYFASGKSLVGALRCRPIAPPLGQPTQAVCIAITGCGVLVVIAGMSRFQTFGQLQATEEGELITDGLYAVSRNPQYAGMVAALAGLSLVRRSPSAVLLTAVWTIVLNVWVKAEEEHLTEHFGEHYRVYRYRVRRWIGRTRF